MGSRKRRIALVRAGVLLVGVAALAGTVVVSVGPYQDFAGYRHAQLCPGGVPTPAVEAHDCVAREVGVVAGRHTYETTDSDGDGTVSTTTHYVVTVRRASGAQEDQDVAIDVYDVSGAGESAALETWRGDIVEMTVAGRTDHFDPQTENDLLIAALVGWIGLGLLVWFLLGDGTLMNLFGNYSLRPVGWFVFGISAITTVHYAFSADLTTGDYVVGTVVWLIVLPLTAICVLGRFAEYDGEPSLLRVLSERLRRRAETRS